jgi:hypothetical protein
MPGELPLEGGGGLLVAALECEQAVPGFGNGRAPSGRAEGRTRHEGRRPEADRHATGTTAEKRLVKINSEARKTTADL